MSIEVFTAVKRRKIGSPTMKSVMLYMADSASDDGSGIWVSKTTMAADLEFKSKRTVQGAIGDLMRVGLVSEVGQRACAHGYTIEYRINLEAVLALPATRARNAPVPQHVGGAGNAPVQEMHPTPAPDAPHGVQEMHPNHPRTILEPCAADAPHKILKEDIGGACLKSGHGGVENAGAGEGGEGGHVSNLDTGFDFDAFLGEFVETYPRLGDLEAVENELQGAIEEGADPAEILTGARVYADEQKGNQRRYIAFAENWLAQKRWEQYEPLAPKPADPDGVDRLNAQRIIEGKVHLVRHLTPSAVRRLIEKGLVTEAQCKSAGVQA